MERYHKLEKLKYLEEEIKQKRLEKQLAEQRLRESQQVNFDQLKVDTQKKEENGSEGMNGGLKELKKERKEGMEEKMDGGERGEKTKT